MNSLGVVSGSPITSERSHVVQVFLAPYYEKLQINVKQPCKHLYTDVEILVGLLGIKGQKRDSRIALSAGRKGNSVGC